MRQNERGVAFVREFADAGKPIAAICHAPWMLIEADVVRGRRVTSYPSLKTDLRNAGAEWVDEEVVVDQGIVTSRTPRDLPAFNAKMLEEFAEGVHTGAHRRPGRRHRRLAYSLLPWSMASLASRRRGRFPSRPARAGPDSGAARRQPTILRRERLGRLEALGADDGHPDVRPWRRPGTGHRAPSARGRGATHELQVAPMPGCSRYATPAHAGPASARSRTTYRSQRLRIRKMINTTNKTSRIINGPGIGMRILQHVAPPEGFEPPTPALGRRRSIH